MRHDHGVTLIEACMVLCVCTVILAAAVPSMRRMVERQALRGAADELRGDLQYLRTTAVTRGQTLWLGSRSGVEGSCYVVYAGARGDCTCQPSGTAACASGAEALKTVAFDAGQSVQLQTTTLLAIEPVRGTVAPTATLKLVGREGQALHEMVNVMGRVRTCSPGAAVPGYKAC